MRGLRNYGRAHGLVQRSPELVIEQWRNDVTAFATYLDSLPDSGVARRYLIRLDRDRPYEPGNVAFTDDWHACERSTRGPDYEHPEPGQRFGKLTVDAVHNFSATVRCDCQHMFTVSIYALIHNKRRSCRICEEPPLSPKLYAPMQVRGREVRRRISRVLHTHDPSTAFKFTVGVVRSKSLQDLLDMGFSNDLALLLKRVCAER